MSTGRVRVAAVAGVAGLVVGIAATLTARRSEQPAPGAAVERRVVRPDRAPSTGLPFSAGILAGDTLYISGHLGRDPVTSQLVPGGIEAETRQSLANIGEVLKAAGMNFGDVTTVTAVITNFDDFATFNAVYQEFFPKDPPARATVQVAALNAGAHVEMQMIAVRR
ncbi:MAG: hypothetical protein HY824_01035 [Acidobacteria bacterium]|nr:hypothetical protein [Acidobacteriota bacterium]